MFSEKEIDNYIKENFRRFEFEIRLRQSDQTVMIYVLSSLIADKIDNKHTSYRQLNNLKKKIYKEFRLNSQIIVIQDESQRVLEAGIFQILNRKFDDKIISLYLSFRVRDTVDIFIEVFNLDDTFKENIADYLEQISDDINLKVGAIHWLDSPSTLPSLVLILTMVKVKQPINIDNLIEEFKKKNYLIEEKWMKRKLDHLRKKGMLLWQHDGATYTVSQLGLSATPAGARKSSSDINRALELARKKW